MTERPIRVLCLLPTPPPFAGPEINGERLIAALPDAGVEVLHVRVNVQDSNSDRGHVSLRSLLGFSRIVIKTLWTAIFARPEVAYLNLSQNVTGVVRDAVLIMICAVARVRTVAHMRGGNFGEFYARQGRVFRWFVRIVLRRLSGIILLADRFRPQFEPFIPRERQFVLYNAVDPGMFARSSHPGGSHDGFTVLYVGHLSEAKGFRDALRVAPRVLAAVPDARFLFAGEWIEDERNLVVPGAPTASLREEWEALSARFPDRLMLLGTIDGRRKEEAFVNADLFFLPSYFEGFPMVVLEAMAAGLPVVATTVGALQETMTNGENGYFSKPGDVDAFVAAILDLAESSEKRTRIAERNLAAVRERFSLSAHVRQLAGVFRAVVGAA